MKMQFPEISKIEKSPRYKHFKTEVFFLKYYISFTTKIEIYKFI